MAQLSLFGYRPGTTVLHRTDARVKLAALILLSLSNLRADSMALLAQTVGVALLISLLRIPFMAVLKELRFFLVLVAVVILARGMSAPGAPILELSAVSITREGLHQGGLIGWRLLLVGTTALLFIASSRSEETKAAVEWLLIPVPFIPRRRVATMIGLLLRFVPMILHQAHETRQAQRARAVDNRKNPVYRLVKLAIPLIRRIFQDAEKLAVAMEARCYSEDRTGPELSSGSRDWMLLAGVVGWCVIINIL